MSKIHKNLVADLMALRTEWTMLDYEEAYRDVWSPFPATVEHAFAEMLEYITQTYDEEYIKECIANEQPNQ